MLAACAGAPVRPPPGRAAAAAAGASKSLAVPVVAARAPPPAFADPERRAKLAARFPALESYFAGQRTAHQLPSLAAGVVIDGELAFAKGFGARDLGGTQPVDADTVYRIGSITKTFTSLAILNLRDQGKLALDDPAVRHLPELAALRYPTADSPPITIRHLLTHASGLPRVGAFNYAQADHDVTEAEMLAALPGTVLMFAPGTRSLYSNFGVSLLGPLITRVAGTPYRDYVTRAILTPLGMTASRWTEADVPADRRATAYRRDGGQLQPVAHWRLGASEAAGGLYSSVRDLARYVAFQLAAYPPRDDPEAGPVRRASVREAHTAAALVGLRVEPAHDGADSPPSLSATASAIGLAWQIHQT
ncbi:MAG TPA: serine hydrolase domain-containing protein, partial [Polyangia bacterium]|nr:serine hydrolase domain-containing protein [Polyangia bacterium]